MGATGFFFLGTVGDPRAIAPEILLGIAATGAVTFVLADALHRARRRRKRCQDSGRTLRDGGGELHEELSSPLLSPEEDHS